jgi:hypothetical protein
MTRPGEGIKFSHAPYQKSCYNALNQLIGSAASHEP